MRFTKAICTFAALTALVGCAGGDGATAPTAVATVQITTPATAPTFQTIGRTLQFSAVARGADGSPIPGVSFSWSSSVGSVATIGAGGSLTVVGNGSTEIRATAQPSGVQSAPVVVGVTQVANGLLVSPAQVSFGALGSTRQLVAALVDSGATPLPDGDAVAWSLLGPGTTASVTPLGVLTSLAVGTLDTVVATSGTFATKVPIAVTQFVASVLVTADGIDTLATTGRTRQYTGAPRDSNANAVPGASIAWSSTAPTIASVDAGSGVATAISDGTTSIIATVGTVMGSRPLTIRRYAATFTLTPPSASITTDGGTQLFEGTATDSASTPLAISWLSRHANVASVAPASGTSTTATGTGNGNTFVVMVGGTRTDSAAVSVSGQVDVPLTASVNVGDFFFRSVRNSTQNAAVDTVGIGGVVTWTWTGSSSHNVFSLGTPSFSSSALQSAGTHQVTFANAGTYQYDCQVHPAMTGRIVVR